MTDPRGEDSRTERLVRELDEVGNSVRERTHREAAALPEGPVEDRLAELVERSLARPAREPRPVRWPFAAAAVVLALLGCWFVARVSGPAPWVADGVLLSGENFEYLDVRVNEDGDLALRFALKDPPPDARYSVTLLEVDDGTNIATYELGQETRWIIPKESVAGKSRRVVARVVASRIGGRVLHRGEFEFTSPGR